MTATCQHEIDHLKNATPNERVAMREAILRGSARNFADHLNGDEEELYAAELREAAVNYAVDLARKLAAADPAKSPGRRGTNAKRFFVRYDDAKTRGRLRWIVADRETGGWSDGGHATRKEAADAANELNEENAR